MTKLTPNGPPPPQLQRFLALEDILMGFSDGIDGARLQAGLTWAKTGRADWQRKDLISLFAAPWVAAQEEAQWEGDAILQGEKDLDEIAAVALQADPVEDFLDQVRAELTRARALFPGDRIMTLAMAEEFGELVKAVLDEPAANVRKEAVQTAVMAARVVLDGDGSVNAWRAAKGLDPLTGSETATAGHVSDARQMVGALAKAGAWIKRALRFIDLCDADAADYQDREMHEDAADLTREGFALFDMGEDACIADLKHAALRAQPQAREEAQASTCQKCGGGIAGWLCQQCPAEFRENEAGALILDEDATPPAPEAEKLREALKHYACSCEPGQCAMSADDTDVPVDDQMCGRRAADALASVQARDPA